MDIGRRGNMVPKRHSQRYCCENKEQTYGKRKGTKEKDKETTKSVMIRKSLVNSWESKELIHTNLRLPLSQRWTNSWRKLSFFREIFQGLSTKKLKRDDQSGEPISFQNLSWCLQMKLKIPIRSTLLKSYTLKTMEINNRHYTHVKHFNLCEKLQFLLFSMQSLQIMALIDY